MKKKLGTLCLAGVIILCAGACGSKSGDKTEQTAQNNTENAVDANNGESKESADSSETELETVKVSEREDYVALQDIDISTYVTLPEYKIRCRLSESESFRLHRFPAYIFSHIAETSQH